MTDNTYTLGFIGIGLMGQPMTLRLLNAGFKVNVWNRTAEKLSAVVNHGAIAHDSIESLLQDADIILLCLADSHVVKHIVEQHIIPSKSPVKLIIDLSSIDPETTRDMAARIKQSNNADWVDAPVSGGTSGAEQGTLAIMAGGAEQPVTIARHILQPLYQRFTHMGPVGSGQMTKICNQMIVSCNVLVIAEMMALAKKAGVDSQKIPEALSGGFADSRPLQITGPEMACHSFEPVKWRVKTLLKDLNMAVEQSTKQGSSIPLSAMAAQLLQLHGSQGFLEADPATLIKLFESD